MYSIGLATMGSSSACLIKDNELLYAIEEERISRIKNDSNFPVQSIKKILEREDISINDIDTFYIYWQPWKIWTRFINTIKKCFYPQQTLSIIKKIFTIFFHFDHINKKKSGTWFELIKIKKTISKYFPEWKGKNKIQFVEHHLSHILYSLSVKNVSESAILSYDGGGEEDSTVLGIFQNQKIEIIKKIKWPNSLGHFYSFFTGFLGFKMLEGEYKMMGLAPLGKPIYKEKILKEVLLLLNDGNYFFDHINFSYHAALEGKFSKKMLKLFGKPRRQNELILQKHIDIASSVQAAFEQAQEHLLIWVKKKYPKIDNLIIGGGCGLNVTSNGNILKNKIFSNISIPPAPHDAGCAVGAALYKFYKKNKYKIDFYNLKNFNNPYLGFNYSNKQILKILEKQKYTTPDQKDFETIYNFIAEQIAKGMVVGWFQGKDEFGPRALGSRSFLADPRRSNMKELLNEKIKLREEFRPFAPSVLKEYMGNFFEIDLDSPYMNIVSRVKKEQKNKIPAVIHVDDTSRVHTVSKLQNLHYYNLISSFYKKTGVPMLLNTSFNIQEPIVCTPLDAIQTFLKCKVDFLVIENFIFDDNWRNKNKFI